jgi:two-component system sensor histidine kinase UhpB
MYMHWRRWPILYRLLLVNALVVAAGAGIGAILTGLLGESSTVTLAALLTAGGILLGAAANVIVLRAALPPPSDVAAVVDSGQSGRASNPGDQNPDMARLTSVLSAALDRLTSHTSTIEANREQLRALSAQVITAQEEERKRIARELHDETSQSLASLIIALERIEAIVPEELAEARRRLASTRTLAQDTLAGLRALVADLRPTVLDDLGLVSAIRWYASSRLEREGIDVSVEAGEAPRLPSRVETALFRIAQEAVSNVVKHAGATQVAIQLETAPGQKGVTLRITDDGCGFDPARLGQGRGDGVRRLGLFGVQERVAALGGQVRIESSPGKGTTLTVQIPLDGVEGTS